MSGVAFARSDGSGKFLGHPDGQNHGVSYRSSPLQQGFCAWEKSYFATLLIDVSTKRQI
jgi:hypothetical protein